MFRLLGITDGPDIGLPAAAALADATVRQTHAMLAGLCREHLLSTGRPDRYQLHDLLRAYARDRALTDAGRSESSAAQHRLAAWYLRTAKQARTALSPNLPELPIAEHDFPSPPLVFASHTEALAWCEAEQSTVVAATLGAAERGDDVLAWQLCTAMYPYFELSKRWGDWNATHRAGRTSAARLGDRLAEGKILCNLGNAYRPLRRTAETLDCYEQALRLFQQTGYRQGEAKVLGNLGNLYHDTGELGRSVAADEAALAIFVELDDMYGEALTRSNLGNSYRSQGRLDAAADCQRRALAGFERLGDRQGMARALAGLGDVERETGGHPDAVARYCRAIALFREVGDRYEEANTLLDLARAHLLAGRRAEAEECRRQALTIYRDLGDRSGEARAVSLA